MTHLTDTQKRLNRYRWFCIVPLIILAIVILVLLYSAHELSKSIAAKDQKIAELEADIARLQKILDNYKRENQNLSSELQAQRHALTACNAEMIVFINAKDWAFSLLDSIVKLWHDSANLCGADFARGVKRIMDKYQKKDF